MKRIGKWLLLLLTVIALLIATAMADDTPSTSTDIETPAPTEVPTATPTLPPLVEDGHKHVAYCDSPGICAVCNGAYTGAVSHSRDGALHSTYGGYYDENTHANACATCGEIISESKHQSSCAYPGYCSTCGAPCSIESISHVPSGEYTTNDTEHGELCDDCGEVIFWGSHRYSCTSSTPNVCDTCGVAFTPTEYSVQHNSLYTAYNETSHWDVCADCGESYYLEEHYAWCDIPGTCALCSVAYNGSNVVHYINLTNGFEYDADSHWSICEVCGDYSIAPVAHRSIKNNGICDVCGQSFTEPTLTPEPTATPAPTGKPSAAETPSGNYAGVASDINGESTAPSNGDSVLSRFQSASIAAAAGSVLNEDGILTLTMDANESEDDEGSVLTVFPSSSRKDGVTICLSSRYEADALVNFTLWQADVTSIDALRETESFKSFVELARALLQSLLPEKTDDELDALLVALLQSGVDGALDDLSIDLDDDVDGKIVGCVTDDNYTFFLVLREEEVELLVRDAV